MIKPLKSYLKNFIKKYRPLEWLFKKIQIIFSSTSDKNEIVNADDPSIVFRQNLDDTIIIENNINVKNHISLPEKLIINAGSYEFFGKTYDCFKPGVYRFIKPQRLNCQRIVLNSENPILNAILISFISIRGNKDDWYDLNNLAIEAKSRFLQITCGKSCFLANKLLEESGFRSRIVYSHTYETLNSYNSGHVLLEVFSEEYNKYILVDLDKKCIFLKNDMPLTLFEVSQNLFKSEVIKVKFFTNVTHLDLVSFVEKKTNFHYSFIEYLHYSSQKQIYTCISRICQIPMIFDNGKFVVCAWDDEIKTKLELINQDFIIISNKDFLSRYYG